MNSAHQRGPWPWVLALLGAIVIPFLVFVSTQGQCFDAAVGAADSSCSSGPSVGWAGAWLITAACAVLFLVSATRLFRLRRNRS